MILYLKINDKLRFEFYVEKFESGVAVGYTGSNKSIALLNVMLKKLFKSFVNQLIGSGKLSRIYLFLVESVCESRLD